MKTRLFIIIAAICLSWTMDASAQKSRVQVVRDYIDALNQMFTSKEYKPTADKLEPIMITPKHTPDGQTIGCRIDDFIAKEIMSEARVKPEVYLTHLWHKCRENQIKIDIVSVTEINGLVFAELKFSGCYNKTIMESFAFLDKSFICAINQDYNFDKWRELNPDVSTVEGASNLSQSEGSSVSHYLANNKPVIKGKVFDASNNEPLVGVTVVQTGTQNGTITDIEGCYTIECPGDASLTFSYIGYKTQTVFINGKNTLPVYLNKDGILRRSISIEFMTENLLYDAFGKLLKYHLLQSKYRRWFPNTTYRPTLTHQFYYGDNKVKTRPDGFMGSLLGLSHWRLKNYSIGCKYSLPYIPRVAASSISLAFDQEGYEIEPIGGEKQWIIKRQLVPSVHLSRRIAWRLLGGVGISYHKPLHYHDNVIDDKNAVNSGYSFNWGVTYMGYGRSFGFRMCHSLYDFYNKDFTMADGSKPFADTRSKIVRMEIYYDF